MEQGQFYSFVPLSVMLPLFPCSYFLSPEHAEADTFFCFTNLMAEIRDNFIKSLDDSQCGITYKMEKVYSTLKEKDVELYLKLVRSQVFLWVLCWMQGVA